MVWIVLGLLLVAGVGITCATALAMNAKKQQQAALQIVPGVASAAPEAWAGDHSPEAKLHRRLGAAVRAAHAQIAVIGGSAVPRVASLDAAAITLDERLIAAAALPANHRPAAIADIATMVDRFENAIAGLAADGTATGELDAAFSQAMGDVEAQLTAFAQARAEVENIDRGTPPPS